MNPESYHEKTRLYFTEKLIPFWADRIAEAKFGGFQSNYDRNGKRTEVTEKNLLCQARCIFSISYSARLGFPWPNSEQLLAQGLDFLFKYFKDRQEGGYFWIVSEDGKTVADDSKVIYGHSFLIYALAEYALLTGDAQIKSEAIRVFDLLQKKAKDPNYGGYFEHFDRKFVLQNVRSDGQIHKSLDVHMHLMEAYTTLYELTQAPEHRQALEEVIELIFTKMLDADTGTGIAMFRPDWQPINNVRLNTVWGRDRFEEKGKPPEITSYGHNIELAWLYLHALDILQRPREQAHPHIVKIFAHTFTHGVDWKHGGIFVEGERNGEVTETTKEFWQQAEAMVGFLEACLTSKDEKYLDAFQNVHDFVFAKMINWQQGEWFALLSREGDVIWDYMGSSWKICYHTIRGTALIMRKLEQVLKGRKGQ